MVDVRSSKEVMATLSWVRKQGFKAVPLHPKSKAAISRDYVDPNYATPSDDIWRHHDYGVGVVTGPASGGPVDVDLDCDEAVFFAPLFLPKTPAIFGRKTKPDSHYLYRVASPSLSKVALLDPDKKGTIIELRADGGHQTVFPGSLHQTTGEEITWSKVPFPDVPTVAEEDLVLAVRKVAIAVVIARHLWVEGQRNEITMHLAGLFFHLEWPQSDAEELIEAVAAWGGDIDPTRRLTVVNTYRKGERGAKIAGANKLRTIIPNPAIVDKLLEWAGSEKINLIQEYNERYATVTLEGKFRIVSLDVPPGSPPHFMSKDDFFDSTLTEYVTIEGKRTSKGRVWFGDPRRASYKDADFMPGVTDHPTVLNLWTGWAMRPAEGSCVAWLELLEHVICGDDPNLYSWMLHWFANILQTPRKRALTAPVMVSKPGGGKSLMLSYFGRILGRAFTTVTNEEHITGRFNKHLGTTLLLHSAEAVYGGDKHHRGILKSLITDDTRIFEQKGIDARAVSNHLRLTLTSNEIHAAPAEAGDRRFTVIDMDNRKITQAHIDRVLEEMDTSGPAALMDYLQKFNYDPAIPKVNIKNEALSAMKSIGALPMDGWWMEALQVGVVLPDYLAWASQPEKEPWPQQVSSTALYTAMVIYLRERGARVTPNEATFAQQLGRWTGVKLKRVQRTYTNLTPESGPVMARALSGRQSTILNLPTLTEARKAFTVYLGGQPIAWDAPEPESDKPLHERF